MEILRFLGGELGSTFKYMMVLFVVPFLYVRACLSVYRNENYREALRKLEGEKVPGESALERRLMIFNLDGWLVASIVALLLVLVATGNVAFISERFVNHAEIGEGSRAAQEEERSGITRGVEGEAGVDERSLVVALMNAYALFLAVICVVGIEYAELGAQKAFVQQAPPGT